MRGEKGKDRVQLFRQGKRSPPASILPNQAKMEGAVLALAGAGVAESSGSDYGTGCRI
jgi:hypothetical protein